MNEYKRALHTQLIMECHELNNKINQCAIPEVGGKMLPEE